MKVTLVGMGCGTKHLLPQAAEVLASAELVVGARRLVEALPRTKARVVVAARAPEVAQAIHAAQVRRSVVVLSGDVGFFSAAMRLTQLLEEDGHDVEAVPGISSVQLLAARLRRPWQDWVLCSAHGRACDVVKELRAGRPVFLLTSDAATVRFVCDELVQAGLDTCTVTVGERLGYADERLRSGDAVRMAQGEYDDLNVMLVEQPANLLARKRTSGLPDDAFVRGRVPMTKQEVRACILAKLAVTHEDTCWDVGAGTGSVSVELALASKGAWAIERNPEAVQLIRQNRERLCAWNLRVVEGTAPDALRELPRPDVVFVGGSAGRLTSILHVAVAANPAVRLCVSAISIETLGTAVAWMEEQGLAPEVTQISVSRARRAADLHLLMASNPVFLVVGSAAADGSAEDGRAADGTSGDTDASLAHAYDGSGDTA